MGQYKMGMVGLGVMGANLLLNLERNGFSGVGFDINPQMVEKFLAGPAKGKQIVGADSFADLAQKLERPRKVVVLVPAGKPVDSVLAELSRVFEPGDVIVEGGNSFYRDTARRETEMGAKGLHFTGMGISGGEEGALNGPSMMPGGPRSGYDALAPLLTKIAAQVADGPCVTYIGPGGAGHFVKMVHNGIEYGDMQLISEAYDLLRRVGGLTNPELAQVFARWNTGELESFLIEITARILGQKEGKNHLVDLILDSAAMKGTGTWTVQEAANYGVAVPTIHAAVDGRLLSSIREERLAAAPLLAHHAPPPPAPLKGAPREEWVNAVADGLYCAKTVSYAQGMALLAKAGKENNWDLPLGAIARIWKGGCIIRAQFLGDIQRAFETRPDLPNLLVDPVFAKTLGEKSAAWRKVVAAGAAHGVPLPAMGSSLAYYDSYRAERLPANLVQAQRDLFGAHTYQRTDKPGTFHTQWE
ncbi:MAG: NADP-dependent phosphogluconate dehydrogenase [Deltaproteobacteria bacterium]|nr:NADP-dependent phosphogluconate dehydrogenase [Deltaproteobacteria bacterium]